MGREVYLYLSHSYTAESETRDRDARAGARRDRGTHRSCVGGRCRRTAQAAGAVEILRLEKSVCEPHLKAESAGRGRLDCCKVNF